MNHDLRTHGLLIPGPEKNSVCLTIIQGVPSCGVGDGLAVQKRALKIRKTNYLGLKLVRLTSACVSYTICCGSNFISRYLFIFCETRNLWLDKKINLNLVCGHVTISDRADFELALPGGSHLASNVNSLSYVSAITRFLPSNPYTLYTGGVINEPLSPDCVHPQACEKFLLSYPLLYRNSSLCQLRFSLFKEIFCVGM